MNTPNDPFAKARRDSGVLRCPFQGESIPMILRHSDVQAAAKDWQTYSSNAPFRVPIPSEENLRTMRQLPIETDPPEHTEWRAIVEPFFKRSRDPQLIAKVNALIGQLLDEAIASESIEIVEGFALKLQCHALTWLLNVPSREAEEWISWGMHVFVKDGGDPEAMDTKLEDYLSERFDEADARNGEGDDFYTALTRARYQGRALTRKEMMGFANLTFAGGRDTVIHTISSIFAYFAENKQALKFLREDPKKRLAKAGEEFFRVVSPLTHLGRVCPRETDVLGEKVTADERVSLCWVSANHDEQVFENPHHVQLDRKPNPHIAFGAGAHFCLGAGHARMLVKALLQALCDKVATITMVDAQPNVEHEAEFTREVGFKSLTVSVSGR